MVLFDGFQLTDVAGPIDVLNVLSTHIDGLSIHLIAEDLSPKSTFPKVWPANMGMSPFTTSQTLTPTHTFETAPELDVLLIPGGMGSFDPNKAGAPNQAVVEPIVKFALERFPKLQYVLTICTGSGILSQSGLLDGQEATLFKGAWGVIPQWRPEVIWQPKARWTEGEKIWTSSGVSSGTDLLFAFVKHLHGEEIAKAIATWMEYNRHHDRLNDPFGISV